MLRCLVAFAFVATACRSAPPTSSTGPSNKAEPIALGAASDDVLAYLPADSDMVLGLDATALRASALWQKFEGEIAASLGAKYTTMRDRCGIDPVRSLTQFSIGGRLGTSGKLEGVMVFRGVASQKALDCFAGEASKNATVTNEKGVLTLTDDNDKMVAMAVGPTTIVAQAGANVTPATLDAIVRSGVPLRTSPAFMTLFDRREPGASMWGMLNGNSSLLGNMAQAGARPKSVDGTVTVRDKFIANMRVTYASPAEADQMLKTVQPFGQMMGGKLDKLDFSTSGAILRGEVVATDEQMKQIFGMLGGFF